MTEKNSSKTDLESTIFSDNNDFDRSFQGSLFQQSLFDSLSVPEKEQVLKSKGIASKVNDFQDGLNNHLQALGGGTNDLTYKGMNFFSRRNLSWQIPKQDAIMRDIPYFDKGAFDIKELIKSRMSEFELSLIKTYSTFITPTLTAVF